MENCKLWEVSFSAKTAVKFRNLQISKVVNPDTTQNFSNSFQGYVHIVWDIHSFKNNSTVSRSGYLYGVNQKFSLTKCFWFFLSLRYFSKIFKKNNNPLLSNSMLKYLIYCPVSSVEVRRLQNQCISIWASSISCYIKQF